MVNRISSWFEPSPGLAADSPDEVPRIGEILEELLAQYEANFPEAQIAVVETSASPW